MRNNVNVRFLTSVIALPLLVLLIYSIWSDHREALRLAETTSRNIAATLEARLDVTLRHVDSGLQELVVTIPVEALNQSANQQYAREVETSLRAHLANFPEVLAVNVFDLQGKVLYSSGNATRKPVPVLRGDHFRTLRDGALAGLFFSKRMGAAEYPQKFMVVARARTENAGAALGIVAAFLDMDYIDKSLGHIDLGAEGAVAVYRSDDYSRIARWPLLKDDIFSILPPSSPTRNALASGSRTATVDSGITADGIRRIYSSHKLQSYPFFVAVGISYTDALALWRTRSIMLSTVILLFLVLVMLLLHRLWRNESVRNQFAAIVENSNDAMMSRALDGTILSWNKGAEKMLGYTAAEAIGKPAWFCVPPGRQKYLQSNNAAVERGEVVVRESDRMTKDGRRIDVLTSHSPVRDSSGNITSISMILQDITARKQAEASARVNEERTKGIVASAMDAIICLDGGHHIVLFNAAAEKLFGYRAADILGKPLDPLIPLRYRDLHRQHLTTFSTTGVNTRTMGNLGQLYGIGASGKEFPMEASISQSGAGEEKFLTVILRDITARLHAEATRASLEDQLRESQKMEAIGTLAGGIAHDFNNALATILGNAELARLDTSGNALALESLEEIRKAGTRARNLVQQILAFSRRQPTERKRIELAPVVAEAVQLLRATLPARLSLEVKCVPDLPTVLADSSQIEQVLINLATNAMQAIPSGPGRVTIQADFLEPDAIPDLSHPALVLLHEKHHGRVVRLAVSDTGIGMDAATRAQIFNPFFTTKPKGEGTGLGLSVVHGIVQEHEGAVIVDSEPGRGTTITIFLPEAAADKTPADANVPASGAMRPIALNTHVLYLDDDAALVSLVQRVLERRGYRVSAFTDQQAALQTLRANPGAIDMVVTDFNMPGLSGLDVAREVRSIRAELPVAIISGYIDDELRTQAGSVGVQELIFKADDVQVFCDAIQRMATLPKGA